jgi:hypothetical protein
MQVDRTVKTIRTCELQHLQTKHGMYYIFSAKMAVDKTRFELHNMV